MESACFATTTSAFCARAVKYEERRTSTMTRRKAACSFAANESTSFSAAWTLFRVEPKSQISCEALPPIVQTSLPDGLTLPNDVGVVAPVAPAPVPVPVAVPAPLAVEPAPEPLVVETTPPLDELRTRW